jgi:hypothetical protein
MYDVALILSVVLFVTNCLVFVRSGAFSVFHPLTFYLAFHGFVFVFRPIVARIMDFELVYQSYGFTPSPADKLTVILACNLGLAAFSAAILWTGRVPMRFAIDRINLAERQRLKPLLPWVLLLCVPVGAYSLLTVWSGAAESGIGYAGMVRDAGTGVYVNTQGVGYLYEAQLMLASCAAMVAWAYRFRLLALVPLLAFVLLRAGTGGRGPFVTALVTVGLLYLYERRRRTLAWWLIGALAVVAAGFNAVGDDRGEAIRRAVGQDASSEIFGRNRDSERFLEGMDFANLEYFEYLVYAIPQRSGTYGYFNGVLQVFTEPVPRALWPGKPAGAPFERIRLFDYGTPVGMTRSLPGEGWYALGWAGVAIWCALWGAMLGWLYRRFVQGSQSTFLTLGYMTFLPILIVAYRDGQIVTVFRQSLFFLGPIVIWVLIARLSGIPSARAVRAMLSRNKAVRKTDAREGSNDPGPRPVAPPQPWASLPPAVRRRRMTLASSDAETH